MMEVVATIGAVRRAKLQSEHHHQQTNTQLFYMPDVLPVAQQCQSNEGKITITSCVRGRHNMPPPLQVDL